MIEEHFRELGTFKSAGPDYLHPKVLKELANVIARPLAFILEKEDWTGEETKEAKSSTFYRRDIY